MDSPESTQHWPAQNGRTLRENQLMDVSITGSSSQACFLCLQEGKSIGVRQGDSYAQRLVKVVFASAWGCDCWNCSYYQTNHWLLIKLCLLKRWWKPCWIEASSCSNEKKLRERHRRMAQLRCIFVGSTTPDPQIQGFWISQLHNWHQQTNVWCSVS